MANHELVSVYGFSTTAAGINTLSLTTPTAVLLEPNPIMADTFDPYCEKLVVETKTVWPDEYDYVEPVDRARIESALHTKPDAAGHMDYVRVHSGFCRQITVTPDDMARLA